MLPGISRVKLGAQDINAIYAGTSIVYSGENVLADFDTLPAFVGPYGASNYKLSGAGTLLRSEDSVLAQQNHKLALLPGVEYSRNQNLTFGGVIRLIEGNPCLGGINIGGGTVATGIQICIDIRKSGSPTSSSLQIRTGTNVAIASSNTTAGPHFGNWYRVEADWLADGTVNARFYTYPQNELISETSAVTNYRQDGLFGVYGYGVTEWDYIYTRGGYA